MALVGKCACGSVSYQILDADVTLQEGVHACHCTTCHAWSGGVYLSVMGGTNVTIINGSNLSIWTSSSWAERAFCKTCGSCMYYRVTAPGPYQGYYYIAAGTLEDWDELKFKKEMYVDCKPQAYEFAGSRETTMTKAQVTAMFSSNDEEKENK